MPELGGGIGPVGGAMGNLGSAAGSVTPAMPSMESIAAPKIPEMTPQVPEIPKPEPTGAEATGPEAANTVLDMAKQGPEAGMKQLADLDLDNLNAEAQQKPITEGETPSTDEKPTSRSLETNIQSTTTTDVQNDEATTKEPTGKTDEQTSEVEGEGQLSLAERLQKLDDNFKRMFQELDQGNEEDEKRDRQRRDEAMRELKEEIKKLREENKDQAEQKEELTRRLRALEARQAQTLELFADVAKQQRLALAMASGQTQKSEQAA